MNVTLFFLVSAIPSAPRSASFSLDGSEVGIWWMRPETDGGRPDVRFRWVMNYISNVKQPPKKLFRLITNM